MQATAPPSPAPSSQLPSFIPPLSDEDRKAAFPDLAGHTLHDRAVQSFILLDQFEWQASRETRAVSLDSKAWIGGDRNRMWLRAEGNGEGGRVDDAELHVLFGRQISRWWDVVAGIRQDFRPGPAQSWAAVGVQGLAPYWFEI
ncbi:MAG TPA: copper resistance protein B, partial [Mycobacterium sp.]|nr:copper resistance protein B [Mycobacterium sp.]